MLFAPCQVNRSATCGTCGSTDGAARKAGRVIPLHRRTLGKRCVDDERGGSTHPPLLRPDRHPHHQTTESSVQSQGRSKEELGFSRDTSENSTRNPTRKDT